MLGSVVCRASKAETIEFSNLTDNTKYFWKKLKKN